MRLVLLIPMVLAVAACINHVNVQCGQDSDCNLSAGGLCTAAAGTADRWCAYPDLSCGPAGYRYSTLDVGDGVSGACVPPVDAGIDASCLALPHTCGVSGNDDCCNSLSVPGGTYFRSYDVAADIDSGDKSAAATVGSFRLDKYEVTVSRFRAFVAEGLGTQAKPPTTGAGAHAAIPGSGWEASWNASLMADTVALVGALKFCNSITVTWTDTPGPNENRPIDCVSWWEAMAFCTWAGGYLPTEAEWNYAATGGDQQRAYPWSTPAGNLTLDSSFASYQDASGNCDGDGSPSCSLADILEVGSKPKGDGRWGQSDLAGNLSEWVLDWSAAYASPCTDCANLSVATERVTRGGNWLSPMRFMRTGVSFTTVPANRAQYYGFRCARKP